MRVLRSIDWHADCLANMRHSLADAEGGLERAQQRVDRLRADVALYERQIAEAKRRGLEQFDSDRLLKNRATIIVD